MPSTLFFSNSLFERKTIRIFTRQHRGERIIKSSLIFAKFFLTDSLSNGKMNSRKKKKKKLLWWHQTSNYVSFEAFIGKVDMFSLPKTFFPDDMKFTINVITKTFQECPTNFHLPSELRNVE